MRYVITLLFLCVFMLSFAEKPVHANEGRAVFAGGCFWCTEAELQELDGVISVTSGYTGGTTADPTYQSMGDHAESVEVIYDDTKITYERLLEVYWSNIDPTDAGGQFYDRGNQYRTAIFYANETQKAAAEQSKAENEKRLGQELATTIEPLKKFYAAEDYHQDYYQTNTQHYERYKTGSGRKEKLEKIWGK